MNNPFVTLARIDGEIDQVDQLIRDLPISTKEKTEFSQVLMDLYAKIESTVNRTV